MERHPAAQELQPQTFVTMQQPEIHSTGNLPPPLGLYNGPYDFWPSGSPLSHIFGTNAIWQPTPIQFTIMTPIDSDGQPIAPHEEQSLEAELEAIQSGAGNAEATESVPVPSRGSSTSPIPSSHPIPTREYPRAATIPGMTPGRTRCDACYENHVSIIIFYTGFS